MQVAEDAVAGLAAGIRIPKAESPDDVQWVHGRAPGTPLICAIESARGLLAAQEIAAVPGVRHLSMGGVDLRRDLGAGDGDLQTLYARSHVVVASRAAGLAPPVDSVYPQLDDDLGLRQQAEFARSLGFFGKSAIHPRQLGTIHDVFTPSADELAWAQTVLEAFAAAEATRSSCRTVNSLTCPSPTVPGACWNSLADVWPAHLTAWHLARCYMPIADRCWRTMAPFASPDVDRHHGLPRSAWCD